MRLAALLALLLGLGPACNGRAAAGAASIRSKDGTARVTIARPVLRPAKLKATALILGEGWGCAQFGGDGANTWQCWEAHGGGDHAPSAWRVPWMDGRSFQSGLDRVCAWEGGSPLRCWPRPVPGHGGRSAPSELEDWSPGPTAPPHPGGLLVGGTMACLQGPERRLLCGGPNGLGQLGAGATTDGYLDLGPIWSAALGVWHGCAVEGESTGPSFVSCWGRDDYGQLGAAATDQCNDHGEGVACARKPVRAGVSAKGRLLVQAGDLFSCATDATGVECWGASRDGFFGERGSCPESLRARWPTLHGTVPAPQSACSATPVRLPGVSEIDPDFRVGPRGICFSGAASFHCVGAIATPRLPLYMATVSPGQDAAACALWDDGVVCWGDGYLAAKDADIPTKITFEEDPKTVETAIVVRGDRAPDGRAWSPRCTARRGCEAPVKPLKPCASGMKVVELYDLPLLRSTKSESLVHVRGRLGLGPGSNNLPDCGEQCCDGFGVSVALRGAEVLELEGLGCGGDQSALCCDLPVYGQTVVASGQLIGSQLYGVDLCTEDAAPVW